MSESIIHGYKTLFEVRLLHHFWLDEDLTLFDQLAVDQKDKRLLTYDARSMMNISPARSTQSLLDAFHCLFRETSLGFVVLATDEIIMPDDTVFEFVLTISQRNFHNYTIHSFYDRPIQEIFYTPELKMYRFKENVFVLENETGTKRGTNLYLSKEIPVMALPATDYPIESLLQSGGALTLISDEKGGTMALYSPTTAANLPVFINQEDIPAIVPPAGLVGAPPKGITLNDEIPDDVYSLIRIHTVHSVDSDFNCTTGGKPKAVAPIFQVRFKNRISNWLYKSKINPSLTTGDLGALPMTFFGNASPGPTKRVKPPTESIQVKYDGVGPTKKIEKIISEIFE